MTLTPYPHSSSRHRPSRLLQLCSSSTLQAPSSALQYTLRLVRLMTLWEHGGSLVDRRLSSEGSWVRISLWPPRRDLGQVLRSQFPGVKLRYSIRALSGAPLSSSELEEAL